MEGEYYDGGDMAALEAEIRAECTEQVEQLTKENEELRKGTYRLLDIGEIIEIDDMFFDGEWRNHTPEHIGTKVNIGHYPIRRLRRDWRSALINPTENKEG